MIDEMTGQIKAPPPQTKTDEAMSGVIAVALKYESNSAILKSFMDAVEEGTLH